MTITRYFIQSRESDGMSDLQQLQNLRDKAIQEGQDVTAIDKQIADLEAQQGQHAERLQHQAVELEELQLPQDYNALFDDHRANDAIMALLKQVIQQSNDQHNAELLVVHQSYQDKLKAGEGALSDLKDAYNALKASYDVLGNELGSVTTAKQLLEDELKDALAKRDNAVTQMYEARAESDKALQAVDGLKGQINDLERQLEPYKNPPKKTVGFHLSPTVEEETPEERQARLKRAETERINARLAERGVDPLPLPDLPVKVTDEDIQKQTQVVQEAAEEAATFPSVVSGDGSGQEAQEGAGEALADVDAPLTLEELDNRVKLLEKAVFWQREQGGVTHRVMASVLG